MWICAAGDSAQLRVDVVDFTNISPFISGLSCQKQRFKILSTLNHYI
jgi:hypothetical protein